MGTSNPEAQKQVTIMTKTLKKKQIILAALLLAANISAFAQDNGMAGINEATSMVTSYFDPGTKLIYAIGAVVGLIGGIKVYGKFSSGGRPRHLEDRRKLVRRVYLPDCKRDHPALVLPLTNGHPIYK